MTPDEMKSRTKTFAIRVIKHVEGLPSGKVSDILGRQLIRSATSVGSNYRAACVGRSRAEFASILQIALEEADESQYWLEMFAGCGLSGGQVHEAIYQEAKEITAILMASLKTTRGV